MKKLRQFLKFDTDEFFKGKDIRVMADEPWNSYSDGRITKILGTKYKCIIALDNTKYDGEDVSFDLNGGEPIVVKVPKDAVEYKKFSKIKFVNATASVYGQFQSELSVQAEDVVIEASKTS